MVVVHYTAMAAGPALARLCDPVFEVSAHYLIDAGGRVFRLVPESRRAWHAGAGAWGDCLDVNSRSVGVELANLGDHPFAAAQMFALQDLLAGIRARWRIPVARVIGHSDIAPTRKQDPGARFDWRALALAGQAVWPGEGTADPADFARFAHDVGYRGADADVLRAVRLRFRPWALGRPLEPRDAGIVADLATRVPVRP